MGKVYRGDYWSDRGIVTVLADEGIYPLPLLMRTDGQPVHAAGHGWGHVGVRSLQMAHDLLADVYGERVPRSIYDPLSESPLLMLLAGPGPWELAEETLRTFVTRLCRDTPIEWGPTLKPVAASETLAAAQEAPEPPPSEKPVVTIWTEGSCRSNPGPAGYAALLVSGEHQREVLGGHPFATNNQMEMLAAIAGLEALKQPCKVTLVTDSQYLRRGITEWIHRWMQNGWENSQGKPVANQKLWIRLHEATQLHEVEWKWVKGHNGHEQNEHVDGLAKKALVAVENGELEACRIE